MLVGNEVIIHLNYKHQRLGVGGRMGRTHATPQKASFAARSVREVSIDSMFLNLFRARLLEVSGVLEVYDVLAGLVLNRYFALSQLVFEWS